MRGRKRSFSSKLKEELARARIEGRAGKVALMSGLIKAVGRIYISDSAVIRIITESSYVARLAHVQFKKTFGLDSGIISNENSTFSQKNIYEITAYNAERALIEMGVLEKNPVGKSIVDEIPFEFRDESFRYYLRGLFLGSGSITDPEKGYHMEIVLRDVVFTRKLTEIINSVYNLSAKSIKRNNETIMYIKGSDKIADFMNVVGAVNCLLEFENIRVIKQVRNNVNRVVNCDTANIDKTARAAHLQIKAIEKLEKIGVLDTLDERYKQISRLRLEHPEAPLSELSKMLIPPITKSGANHRLKKLIELAKLY